MNNLRQAAQQAWEALKMMRDKYEEYACPACAHADAAVYALEQALAEPERKPLSDDQIALISVECAATHKHDDFSFARAIEAAHGIKEQEQ